MASEQDEILLLQEVFTLFVESTNTDESMSDPLEPRLPAEHYDALARAIVSLARIRSDPEDTVRMLARLMPLIEVNAVLRSRRIAQRVSREPDPELEAFRELSDDEQEAYLAEQEAELATLNRQVAQRLKELLANIRNAGL